MRVFILVKGGLVQTVATDPGVDVMILDGDISDDAETSAMDGAKEYIDMDGDAFEACEVFPVVTYNQNIVDHYFKQRAI